MSADKNVPIKPHSRSPHERAGVRIRAAADGGQGDVCFDRYTSMIAGKIILSKLYTECDVKGSATYFYEAI